MWFFRSVEFLRRPSLVWLAPTIAMLVVWGVFEGTEPTVFGQPVLPLWLALVANFALRLAARGPSALVRARRDRSAWAIWTVLVGMVAAAIGGAFVHDPWLLQLVWLLGLLVYVANFAVAMLVFTPEDFARMPSRWAGATPFSRLAMWLVVLRWAVVGLGASWLMVHGTETDWVLFVSLGTLALYYLFDWITVFLAITRPRDDG